MPLSLQIDGDKGSILFPITLGNGYFEFGLVVLRPAEQETSAGCNRSYFIIGRMLLQDLSGLFDHRKKTPAYAGVL